MTGLVTSATYYRDVRVPSTALIGPEHGGWPLITNQLNHERVALTPAAPLRSVLHEVQEWARQTRGPGGRRVIDAEWVQLNLARVQAKVDVLWLMNARIAAGAEQSVNPAEASATKVFGTELATEAYRLLMEVLGPAACVQDGSPGAALRGRVERMHRSALILTFGGGTNEIQRDIIATVGLRLPAGKR
jgi:alkylation response protein AidB-like acyl-CoA dehydrogenase